MHLARHLGARGKLAQNIRRGLARRAHHIGREALELHIVFLDQRGQRLGVEPLHLAERVARFRSAGVRDDRLQVGLERLPGLQRHDAFAGAVRLVEAGAGVDRRDAIEPERDVGAGADELGGVEHAGLQRGEDFAGRRRLRRRAEPAIDLAAEAERADLQAAHVVERFDLAAEPAAHAHAGVAAHERLDAERRVELVPQRLPAAGLDPGDVLVRRQPERHGGEDRRGRHLALPEERRRVADFGDAAADRVEHLEGGHDFARG